MDIVIPVFNEGPSLQKNLAVITETVSEIEGINFKLIVVNDGSTDDTPDRLGHMLKAGSALQLISLTRNFGKEAAIMAGLEHADGDIVVVMDSDLQHPPELIEKMISLWREGVDVVQACKRSRGKESLLKKMSANVFYSFFALLAGRDIKDHSDFKLLDKKVVDAYLAMPERNRFFRGLVSWMGFSSAQVFFDVPERSQGKSGWNSIKLFRLSVDAITGFTSAPLYLINLMGIICFLLGMIVGGIALYDKFTGQAVSGFTTVILLILLIGGFIMFGLGLIGVYLGQIFKETKNRPLYLIDKKRSITRDD